MNISDDPNMVILDSAPLPLTRHVLPEDERVPGKLVIATSVNGRLIARCSLDRETWDLAADTIAPGRPCVVRYVGTDDDPGIHATLWAIIPTDALPQVDGVPFIGANDEVGIFLGVAVRYAHDRKHPNDFAAECADHFSAILDGHGVEPVERALAGL